MVVKFVQAQNFFLAGAGAVTGATTIVLKSFLGINGTALTMTDFGDIGFATLEPGNNTQEEQISFTGVTQNANGTATLTGISSVLFISPHTTTSGILKTHPGSATLVISNTSGFYNQFFLQGTAVGPASSTDNAIVRFNGTTGKLLQDSALTILDLSVNDLGVVPPTRAGQGINLTIAGGNSTDGASGGLILAGADSVGANDGAEGKLKGGKGGATGAGGPAYLLGGTGGGTNGAGGPVIVQGGDGAVSGGAGGAANIYGGTAKGGNSNGGGVNIFGGIKTGSGVRGQIYLYPDANSSYAAILDLDSIVSSFKTFTLPNQSGIFLLEELVSTTCTVSTNDLIANFDLTTILAGSTESIIVSAICQLSSTNFTTNIILGRASAGVTPTGNTSILLVNGQSIAFSKSAGSTPTGIAVIMTSATNLRVTNTYGSTPGAGGAAKLKIIIQNFPNI